MIDRLRKRISAGNREGGFTLIELLVVLIIIAVLLAIAIPAYLGFKDRAEKRAAQSNVRESVPTAEAYAEDNNGTANDSDGNAATSGYDGMTLAFLQQIDPNAKLDGDPQNVTTDTFCIQDTVGKYTAWFVRDQNDPNNGVVQVDLTSNGAGC